MPKTHNPDEPPRRRWLLLCILGLSSALSAAFCIFRIWYSETFVYFFLNWNLLLAWIPLGLALLLWHLHRRAQRTRLLMLGVFAGWLLFFPNAPYIVSDLMHLGPRNGVPIWFDAIMVFSFAWNGLILGFVSLWLVQQWVAGWLGSAAGWMLVVCTLGATGFGIYLGRFQRWNSWDILVQPTGLLRDIAVLVANPFDSPRTVGVTVLFAGFLMVAYLTVTLLPSALRGERAK